MRKRDIRIESFQDVTTKVWQFFLERWNTQAYADPSLVIIVTAVVVFLTIIPRVWRFARQASTIIHEMGHVFAAWLSGRRVAGIRLHTDTSGVTVTSGKPYGPGVLFTMLAGYPAPGVLALAMAWLASTGNAGVALTVYQGILVIALVLSRNVVGIVSCLLSLLITGLIWWNNDPLMVLYTVIALSVFYSLSGLRSTIDLTGIHLRASGLARGASPRKTGRNTARSESRQRALGTDAAQAATAWKALPIPTFLWLFLFIVISSGTTAATFWLLFGEVLDFSSL